MTLGISMSILHQLLHYFIITGRTWLEALSGYHLRNTLQNAERIGIFKIYMKEGSGMLGRRICSVLNGFISVSSLQTKARH